MSEFNDAASVQSAVSLPLRNPNPPRPKNPSYKNYDFGFRSKNRNPLPPPEDDWVVIRTRKNPQADQSLILHLLSPTINKITNILAEIYS